jgi:hypothetical protein
VIQNLKELARTPFSWNKREFFVTRLKIRRDQFYPASIPSFSFAGEKPFEIFGKKYLRTFSCPEN